MGWYDVVGSFGVMFFMFYIMVRWFLRVLEDRIRFIEGMYNELCSELRLLREDVRELVSCLRDLNGSLGSGVV